MKTVKEAADKLLSENEITKDFYDGLEKKGFFKEAAGEKIVNPFLSAFRKFSIPVAVTGATLAAGKEMIINPLIQRSQIRDSFNMMKSKVPQLEGKDDGEIKDYFNVVKTFSPKSASNPLVAGALVNKMMEFGGVDHKLVQDISAIEQGLQTQGVAQKAMESAAKAIVGQD